MVKESQQCTDGRDKYWVFFAHFQALAAGIIKEWIIKVLTIKHCWTGYLARILPD